MEALSGSASGIGEETARVLALRGARVVIAARNIDAANAARGRIIDSDPDAIIDVLKLDRSLSTSATESLECLEMGGDKWGAMMWRPTWIPRRRGRPRQHTQHPLGLM